MKTIVPNWNVPPHIQAFTTTREGGVSLPPFDSFNLGDHVEDDKSAVKTNRTLLVEKFNLPHFPLFLTQTHSTRVITVPYEGNNFEADAVYTNQPNQVCLVMTADCLPVLFTNKQGTEVAAAHAGWRGTALGIAAKAVERMVDCYGCDRLDILAAVGPGISKCCFETHEDVPNAMTEAMGAAALSSIEVLPTGKFHVDLKGLNAKRLESAGLDPDHIAVSADCTCCLPEKYWSHRYTHGERGSQAAMIAIV